MKLKSVFIQNFRKISELSFELERDIGVVVGPNAVGKTTIFEAIRLVKALLSPRGHDESAQVLINLGASTANILFGPFHYDFSALAGDPTRPIEIRLEFLLEPADLDKLEPQMPSLAQQIAAAKIGQNFDQARLAMIPYFASPEGRANLESSEQEARARYAELRRGKPLPITLKITESQLGGDNLLDQIFLAALERLVHPFRALFSYFPADRAMPAGETSVQLGSGDMKAQVDSHLALPANKYARLKQVIMNEAVLAGFQTAKIAEDFNAILAYFLPGKTLSGFEQRPTGQLRVLVHDAESKRTFDIDGLSSGEKGLILTFLLLRTAMERGGIALLDEPELHLHPSLCNRILPFLVETAETRGLQILFSTHSPDLLKGSLDSDRCQVFHLRSPKEISPIYTSDRRESLDAARRLGVSAADLFLSRAHVFVEGEDDKDILEAGFSDQLLGCSVNGLGGRGEVEKHILQLQKAEQQGEVDRIHLFIFDHDRKPSTLSSSELVRVVQLDRYCIENFLLDPEILLLIFRRYRKESAPEFMMNDLNAAIQTLWKEQLREIASIEAHGEIRAINCDVKPVEIRGKTFDENAQLMLKRIEEAKMKLLNLNEESWRNSFLSAVQMLFNQREHEWRTDWKKIANGKLMLQRLQRQFEVGPLTRIKVDIAREMRSRQTDDWKAIKEVLETHLASN